MKLGGGRYRAATQVKGLSPEIASVSEAEAFHLAGGSILLTESGKLMRTRRGLPAHGQAGEAVSRYQMELIGTREDRSIYQRESLDPFSGIGGDKPIDGEELRNYTLVLRLVHSSDEVL